jgi:hypothetical protein
MRHVLFDAEPEPEDRQPAGTFDPGSGLTLDPATGRPVVADGAGRALLKTQTYLPSEVEDEPA